MKKLLTLFIVLSFYQAFSCSGIPDPFCYVAQYPSARNIIIGKIIDSVPRGIRLKVIHVLRGTETRDTVTIWDASDFICMDTTPMPASLLGNIGDTILGVLQMIDSMPEPWQLIGDYVSPPDIWALASILKIENDTVKGFISGDASSPPQYRVMEMKFGDFMTYWNTHGSSCYTLTVGINEEEDNQLIISPNPTTTSFTLQLSSAPTNLTSFLLFDALGRQVMQQQVVSENTTVLRGSLPNGIYFWQLQSENKVLDRGKVFFE